MRVTDCSVFMGSIGRVAGRLQSEEFAELGVLVEHAEMTVLLRMLLGKITPTT